MECSIAVLILGQASWRRKALAFAIFLHLGIIVTMGLWSFALTMIGAVMIAAAPDWVAPPSEILSFNRGVSSCRGSRLRGMVPSLMSCLG